MTGVPVPEDGSEIVTTMDVREKLSEPMEEIEQFVNANKNEGMWEYSEVELFEGVTLVLDWSFEGVRDTYFIVDKQEIGDWYESPDSAEVTKRRTEVVEVSEEVAWAMVVFRDDALVHNPHSQREQMGEGSLRVTIDNSGRMGPQFLTKMLRGISLIDEVPGLLEYSESNSTERVDVWV